MINIDKNNLINDPSPYLQQHKDNPVNWQIWSSEIIKSAKKKSKPILLSIGYASCHWCHVMAHESFEDNETADLMNRYFTHCKKIQKYSEVEFRNIITKEITLSESRNQFINIKSKIIINIYII